MKTRTSISLRLFSAFLILLLLFPLLVTTARADMGPKPSVVVQVKGLESESYAVTLLSEEDSTGPWSKQASYEETYYDEEDNEAVWTALNNYEDPDGFYFLGYYEILGDKSLSENSFEWGYYPPDTFKFLIYLPEMDTYIASDTIYHSYAFNSCYTVTVENGAITQVEQNWSAVLHLPSLLFRVAVTIAAELLLALCFRFRSRHALVFITVTNVVTQLLLNFLLNLVAYFAGSVFLALLFYLPFELLIATAEGVLYRHFVSPKEPKKTAPMAYSFAANTASFVLGVALGKYWPWLI